MPESLKRTAPMTLFAQRIHIYLIGKKANEANANKKTTHNNQICSSISYYMQQFHVFFFFVPFRNRIIAIEMKYLLFRMAIIFGMYVIQRAAGFLFDKHSSSSLITCISGRAVFVCSHWLCFSCALKSLLCIIYIFAQRQHVRGCHQWWYIH